jgi:hypothetical protein
MSDFITLVLEMISYYSLIYHFNLKIFKLETCTLPIDFVFILINLIR